MRRATTLLIAALALIAARVDAYPLDGWEETGIDRLKAYDLMRDYLLRIGQLRPGSLRGTAEIQLRLLDRPDLERPEPSQEFSEQIRVQLGADADKYGVALLDLSNPDQPLYAEHNPMMASNPGSVGKLVVLLAWFQALADVYPDDVGARQRLMRETEVVADEFIRNDHHVVPVWEPGQPRVIRRPITEGDRANLWTVFDWTASASSNAGASMLMAQLVLLKHFGAEYPVSEEAAAAFLQRHSAPAAPGDLHGCHPDAAPPERDRLSLLPTGEVLHPGGAAALRGHEQRFNGPRARALRDAHGAGVARRRLVEPADQATDLSDGLADSLRVLPRSQQRGGLLQVRVALLVPARAGLHLWAERREPFELHELGGDHRDRGERPGAPLPGGGALECAAQELGTGAPRAGGAHPPDRPVAAPRDGPERGRGPQWPRGRLARRYPSVRRAMIASSALAISISHLPPSGWLMRATAM